MAAIVDHEPILESRLAARGAGAGLASMIPPGMRAVAIRVNEVVGVGGFVVPGMRVDILISGAPPATTGAGQSDENHTAKYRGALGRAGFPPGCRRQADLGAGRQSARDTRSRPRNSASPPTRPPSNWCSAIRSTPGPLKPRGLPWGSCSATVSRHPRPPRPLPPRAAPAPSGSDRQRSAHSAQTSRACPHPGDHQRRQTRGNEISGVAPMEVGLTFILVLTAAAACLKAESVRHRKRRARCRPGEGITAHCRQVSGGRQSGESSSASRSPTAIWPKRSRSVRRKCWSTARPPAKLPSSSGSRAAPALLRSDVRQGTGRIDAVRAELAQRIWRPGRHASISKTTPRFSAAQ